MRDPFNFERLLIVRTSAMGDIIHALPAVAALRDSLPGIMIGWVVEERWVELLCSPETSRLGTLSAGRPLADSVHTINTKGWRRSMISLETWRQISNSVYDLRDPRYQVAADFQGSLRSGLIARLSGAKEICGFRKPRERIAATFYTQRVATSAAHVVEQNFELAESAAGRGLQMGKPEIPRDETADQECERYLKENHIAHFALVNPGAGWGAKQWPAERYGDVGRQLANDGLRCLIKCGPDEKSLALAVEAASEGCAVSLSLSVTQLIAFTRRAALFVGGDTGPMHLAAALNVPVVAIFGPTDPLRNGPYGTDSVVLRSPSSLTSHKQRPQPEEGLLKISVGEVVAAARKLLKGTRA